MLRRLVDREMGIEAAVADAQAQLGTIYANVGSHARELRITIEAPHRYEPTGSGYVVDTLWSALRVARRPSFAEAVRAAVALGNDTDTTACVAGAIAGALHRHRAIPNEWLRQLRGKGEADALAARLAAQRS